ncbi:MAG: dual specificity protein phosphatase family protein [Anaerolineales bacterium]|nr:dual specificity protein phosphatase family protein [Anaerolineales bacterium]MCB8954310.1 dual specificity protein phosphatase family protein [Ardenticatenales bacterium]
MISPNPPIPNAYWVLPGQLLAGAYPGAQDEAVARDKLEKLGNAGISYFLNLTEPTELKPYHPFLHPAIVHHRLSIPDFSTPTPDHMTAILDALDAALAQGHTVYLHCWGGIGRTGTVVGCYLVRHGWDAAAALAQIARWRQNTPDGHRPSPETEAQQQMVLHWQEKSDHLPARGFDVQQPG